MAKIKKLERIMKGICNELRVQVGVDITLGQNPARIYFTFENRDESRDVGLYLTSGDSVEEVFKIAEKYGLQRDKSAPKYKPKNRVALRFKLKYKDKSKGE